MFWSTDRSICGATIAYLTQASRATGMNQVSEILSQLRDSHGVGFNEQKMTCDFEKVM
jgi:hypothetical protein